MATTPSAQVGANIRAELARRGISQAQLGERLGITQPAVSQRLLGRVPFDVNELHDIAAFLGVPLAALINDPAAA